jgi:hypothetical protein
MLEDLVQVIETIQGRIREHGTALRKNETQTRTALIDPLLTALGWDTGDPNLVTPEYRVDVGWADYALRGVGNTPATVVEAKRLGSMVENHLDQAVGYCIQQGIAYAGVTDGSRWQLYRTFEPVPMADKIVLDVNIENTPAHRCALQLLLMWRPNLGSGSPIPANEPLFELEPEPRTISHTGVSETGSRSSEPATAPGEEAWVRLSEFDPPNGSVAPASVRFPEGITRRVGSWRRLPVATAEWLYSQQKLSKGNLPVASGRKGFAANSLPMHRDGSQMITYETIGDGEVVLNVHLSSRAARENAKKLLEHCGVDPADVYVQTGG